MELAQYHGFLPQTRDGVSEALRRALRPGWLHPRAELGITVSGAWRPADRWAGALERLVWSVGLDAGGSPLLSSAGEAALGAIGLARRQAPLHPVELLAQRAGEGLVLIHSDATRLAYVAVYRQRHLAWSLLLQDQVRLVRCDGEVVVVDAPPRFVPEGDRAGVLLAGWGRWLGEPPVIDDAERYVLADSLALLSGEAAPLGLVQGGEWMAQPGEQRRGAAAG